MRLTAGQRNRLPGSAFALPGRRFPINDPTHARAALSRASANATPAERSKITAKVHRQFPGIAIKGEGKASGGTVDEKPPLVECMHCGGMTPGYAGGGGISDTPAPTPQADDFFRNPPAHRRHVRRR